MSYRIVYGPEPKAARKEKHGPFRLQMLTAACLIAFVMLVKLFWPEGNIKLQQYLLPGEPGATQQALEEMIDNLRDGAEMGDAFTAFCQQIIDNGKTAE